VDGVPWLVNELFVEGAALFQGVNKGRPSETTGQKRGRTRVRKRERRQGRERKLQGAMRGRRGGELAAGEIEEGSACWYLLNSHRGGGGGFVFTLFYSVVARISQTPEPEDHTS
jgi:hypothetical protein